MRHQVWLAQIPFLYMHPNNLRYLFMTKSILVPICFIAMLIWAFRSTGGTGGPLLSSAAKSKESGSVYSYAWLSSLTSVRPPPVPPLPIPSPQESQLNPTPGHRQLRHPIRQHARLLTLQQSQREMAMAVRADAAYRLHLHRLHRHRMHLGRSSALRLSRLEPRDANRQLAEPRVPILRRTRLLPRRFGRQHQRQQPLRRQ